MKAVCSLSAKRLNIADIPISVISAESLKTLSALRRLNTDKWRYKIKNRYLHINGLFEENIGVKLNKTQIKIIELIKNNPDITIEKMAEYAGVEKRTIERKGNPHQNWC